MKKQKKKKKRNIEHNCLGLFVGDCFFVQKVKNVYIVDVDIYYTFI